jgi:hypothetical protein
MVEFAIIPLLGVDSSQGNDVVVDPDTFLLVVKSIHSKSMMNRQQIVQLSMIL